MGDEPADSTENAAAATDPLLAAVGARILEIRVSRGLGVTDAAAAAGMNKGHWWRLEAGQHNLSVKVLARVATALRTEMSDLLRGVAAPTPPDAIHRRQDGKAARANRGADGKNAVATAEPRRKSPSPGLR